MLNMGRKKGFTMAELISWQELYRDAMLEVDPASLRRRIDAARAAIGQAMEDPNPNRKLEDKQAMIEAVRNLQTLERLELQRSTPSRSPLTASTEE
jgi:hypothetical protein